jgi:hypothetical protein
MHEVRRRLDQPIEFQLEPVIEHEQFPDLPDQSLATWLRDQILD